MIKNIILILVILMNISCKKCISTPKLAFIEQTNIDTLEINYYSNKKTKNLLLSEFEGNKNVKLHYDEEGLLKLKTINYNNYPEINIEFNENEKKIHQWTIDDIGGCIGIKGKEFYWNNKGAIIKEIYHYSTDTFCSEKVIYKIEKEFYENSKIVKSITNHHESYEGSEECPCGEWINYDASGKELNRKSYVPCNTLPSCLLNDE